MLAAGAVAVSLATAAILFFSSQGQGQPDTTRSSAPRKPRSYGETWNPTIRVNLTPTTLAEVPFSVDGPCSIIVPGTNRVLSTPNRIEKTVAAVDGAGIRIGETLFPASELEIVPVRTPAIWVGRHQYRGTVRLLRRTGDRLIAVNHVPLEEYIASVVFSEVPSTFGLAARQAQAIVARTYAVSHMKGHPRFDVFATSRSQMYLGFQYENSEGKRLAGESQNTRDIATETAGVVCTHNGKVFTAYYSAVCGGRTINGRTVFTDAAPVVKNVECNWCREADRYRWDSTVPVDEASRLLADHLKAKGKTLGTVRSIKLAAGPSGDLPFYNVSDGKISHKIAGTDLRRIMPYGVLHSPDFEASPDATTIRFSGRGHGHGVGFCQWGAAGQAKARRSALEIIRYYYPGAGTVRLRPPKATGPSD